MTITRYRLFNGPASNYFPLVRLKRARVRFRWAAIRLAESGTMIQATGAGLLLTEWRPL
jgi:hypothetical protein